MSEYRKLRFRITGVCPLLMHNSRLADPLDEHTQQIAELTGKQKKTIADHLRVAELEWRGGLYLWQGAPCIPAEMMEGALLQAAKAGRKGPRAKAGLIIAHNLPLEYEGERDPDAMWASGGFRLRCAVRVKTARVIRTRPKFDAWAANVVVDFVPSLLDPADVRRFMTLAGEQVGLGDWRPRFGRFWTDDGVLE